MIDNLEQSDMPTLKEFPSAKAQPRAPIRGHARPPSKARRHRITGPLKLLIRAVSVLLVLAILASAVLLYMMARAPVSHETLRAQVASQLTTLLGEGRKVEVKDASISFGKAGIFSLDATGVNVDNQDGSNLGKISSVTAKIDALSLLKNEVVIEKISLDGARIELPVSDIMTTGDNTRWPESLDFSQLAVSLGHFFRDLNGSVKSAGLESISFRNTELAGFEKLGMRSPSARLVELTVLRDANFQKGLSFGGMIETPHSNWTLTGSWKELANGETSFSLSVAGLDISDFFKDAEPKKNELQNPDYVNDPRNTGAIQFVLEAPFASDGSPRQAILAVKIENARFAREDHEDARLQKAQFNLRYLPEKNQIELERSPVQFLTTEAVLIGGLRYPVDEAAATKSRPIFQLAANNVLAYGLVGNEPRQRAAINLLGSLEVSSKTVVAEKIELLTKNGRLDGTGSVSFASEKPHYSAQLAIAEMGVTEFKQFWPDILATKTRRWAEEGIWNGTIKNGSLNVDFPPGVFGDEKNYSEKNLSVKVPLVGVSVKTIGKLPVISQANGVVDFDGRITEITLEGGTVNTPGGSQIDVTSGRFNLGDFTEPKAIASLDLSLEGAAGDIGYLGTLEPIRFADKISLDPSSLSGRASVDATAKFILSDIKKQGLEDWQANLKLSNVSASKPLLGRKVENANLQIIAVPGQADIKGKATLDGVPAEISMVENFDGSSGSDSAVTLVLDDKARKKLGIDAGAILTGPVTLKVTSAGSDKQRIKADLKNAKLNFPWVDWSKGKGIPATAEFTLITKSGVSSVSGFVLRGKNFSAKGNFKVDKSGLREASLKNIRLNKTDKFDVDINRSKQGYSISVGASSYDARALIRSMMEGKSAKTLSQSGGRVFVKGKIGSLVGFGGQKLSNVSINFALRNGDIEKAALEGVAAGRAFTAFSLKPVGGETEMSITTQNAGSVLAFLDLYSKVRGGTISAKLTRSKSRVFRGRVNAENFTLLKEPRLAALLQKPQASPDVERGQQVVAALKKIRTDSVVIDRLEATIEKGPGFLNISRGRLAGGDANAAFEGQVYDKNNRMRITGTFLPARGLNRLVSNIPIIGLAFGRGKVNGLLGITFKLSGRYGNPRLQVNPLSIIAPGVFRNIFKFN